MFEKCNNCGARAIGGTSDENGQFCSQQCRFYFRHPNFCGGCTMATTDVSSGGTFTFNGIGTALWGSGDPCPTCGSVVKRLFFTFVYIPLFPLGKYRVKHATPRRFISRKLAPNTPR